MAEGGVVDLDCGIARERIRSWLDEELSLSFAGGAWLFAFGPGACSVEVEPLGSRPVGPVKLDRTHVRASGDQEALAEFKRLFFLRFASAGG